MGVKRNIVYSSILTVSGYLFPLITFPYVTRVLGVVNFGICNFYDGVVSYFILFSMLGIVNLGIREIARVKDDKKELTKVFSGLLTLNLITTAISIIALIIIGLSVPELAEHPHMIYIGIGKVLVNSLLVEWFYKGIEDFKYITMRSILIRSIYVVAVLIFVRDRDDYVIYFGLTTLMFAVNSAINIFHLRRFINITGLNFKFKKFVKPYLILGVYQLLTSMYTTINVVILGFMAGEAQVGYYSTATKLYTIIMSFYSAFTGVLMPRMSRLIAENSQDEFNNLVAKSSGVLYFVSVPIIIISTFFAPTIVNIIAGPEFEPAVIPMRIVMPLMLICGLEQILIYQILFPLKQDKAILINSVFGASVGLILNFTIVPHLQSMGSAITWVSSEITVLCSALYFVFKIKHYNINLISLVKILAFSIPVVLLMLLFRITSQQDFLTLIITSILMGLYYLILDKYVFHIIGINNILHRMKSYLK